MRAACSPCERSSRKAPSPWASAGVTINDMVLYAVARALTRFPEMNALFVGDTLKQYSSVHLGFAVDTPKGLMVPVVSDAHSLSLRDTAREAARLISRLPRRGDPARRKWPAAPSP